ncbi:hypothetical protein OIU77_007642 [Salix suchowensis]|uniref:Uncharacterized protein n=1 Tax=Salix suchowensis TaxID=1278906 RepID=A0ABQ9AI64_9ROSI|nr:hypothetical protein OIU77_007642 [Salix suchowensis]KAJ6374343.1 hypothetical protein OIU78_029954 [Salix suchowensis]
MAARNLRQFHLHYLRFLAIIHANLLSSTVSDQVQSCDSYLYHISEGLSDEQMASFYSVKSSNAEPITHGRPQTRLSCISSMHLQDVKGTPGYFNDTLYNLMIYFPMLHGFSVAGKLGRLQEWNDYLVLEM